MKRAILTLTAALLLSPAMGCFHHHVPQHGAACGPGAPCGAGNCGGLLGVLGSGKIVEGHYKKHGWRHQPEQTGPAGPPSGTVGYPYYTLHGPRDFLANDPPGLD